MFGGTDEATGVGESMELKASEGASDSDDETIILDNTQARVPGF